MRGHPKRSPDGMNPPAAKAQQQVGKLPKKATRSNWRGACFWLEAGSTRANTRNAMSKPTNSDGAPRACDAASETADSRPESGPSHARRPRVTLFMAVSLAALTIVSVALAGEYHSNPWLLSWIPATCCVTNDCCWQVTERELKSLPNDQWEVISTGQVRNRTDWSPDGKFYRCACDYDATSRHWIRHQGANTRCIFVPMRTAGL